MLRWFSESTSKIKKKLRLHWIPRERIRRLKRLCSKLSIGIKDYRLLDRAFTHTSSLERPGRYEEAYERLEFLGDSILNASIAYLLYSNHPSLTEGGLSSLRSSLVDEKTLSGVSFELHLLDYVNLGKGETLSDPRAREKVAADVLEALIGVIFLENGFEKALKFVKGILGDEIELRIKSGTRDYKTQLQKLSVSRYKEYPVYQVLREIGPDHNKIFEVVVNVHNKYTATAKGRTKKEAEQNAAEIVLKQMK